MNPDIKAAWLEALRSGRYTQGKNVLRTYDDRYCCLGVLCDLHSKATGTKWDKNSQFCYEYEEAEGVLPHSVVSWAELDGDLLYYDDPDTEFCTVAVTIGQESHRRDDLALLNDRGESFEMIADLIEAYIPVR